MNVRLEDISNLINELTIKIDHILIQQNIMLNSISYPLYTIPMGDPFQTSIINDQ